MGKNNTNPNRLHNLEALTSCKRNNKTQSLGIAMPSPNSFMVQNHSANEIFLNTHNKSIVKYNNPLEDK